MASNCLMCSYCGHEVWFEDGQRAQAMTDANAHAFSCSASPLVRRIRELEQALAQQPRRQPAEDRDRAAALLRNAPLRSVAPEVVCSCSICVQFATQQHIQRHAHAAIQEAASDVWGGKVPLCTVHVPWLSKDSLGATIFAVMSEGAWQQIAGRMAAETRA